MLKAIFTVIRSEENLGIVHAFLDLRI